MPVSAGSSHQFAMPGVSRALVDSGGTRSRFTSQRQEARMANRRLRRFRRRQPLLRGDGRVHAAPARRTGRGWCTWATINGKPRMVVDNKVFRFIPNPTFDPVAKPGRARRVLPRQARRRLHPRRVRRPRADQPRVPRAGGTPQADGRAAAAGLLHVPDARRRRRRSAVARSRRAARRVPRVQRVDARRLDVQLPGSHLRGAVHLPPGSRARPSRKSTGRSTTARTSS